MLLISGINVITFESSQVPDKSPGKSMLAGVGSGLRGIVLEQRLELLLC